MNNNFLNFLDGGYKGISQIRTEFPNELNNIIEFNKNFKITNWGQMLFNYLNNISELPKCKCGNLVKFIKFNRGYTTHCSVKCKGSDEDIKNRIKQGYLKKYGVENPLQSLEVQEKRKKLFFEKHGVEHQSQLAEVREKRKQTCLKKFGTTTNLLCKDTKNKIKQTNLLKFGVEHNSQSAKIKEKKKQTCLKKFGVEYNLQSSDTKEKIKRTNLIKYGVECSLLNKNVKEKANKTNLKRYGVKNPNSSLEIKDKIKKTSLERFGVEYPSQNKLVSEKIVNTMIERYGEIWKKRVPSYNANSIIYLDMISEKLGLPIQHALNGGEKKFIRYWVDGYIEKYNICIEWDEISHNETKQKERDLIRENFLKEKHNCHIIRINEKEFLKDIDNQINITCDKIKDMIRIINKSTVNIMTS
jgi:hypothetical protein